MWRVELYFGKFIQTQLFGNAGDFNEILCDLYDFNMPDFIRFHFITLC